MKKVKTVGRRALSIALAVLMLASVMSVSAVTYTYNGFEHDTPNTYKDTSVTPNVTKNVYVTKTTPDGTATNVDVNSLKAFKKAKGVQADIDPTVFQEELVTYKIPAVDTREVTLTRVTEPIGFVLPESDTGRAVRKVYNKTDNVAKATVVDVDANGRTVPKMENGEIVMSDEPANFTASTKWGKFLFVAMNFWDTYNTDYASVLLVYDTENLSAGPVAEWDLQDLGLYVDAYETYANVTAVGGNTKDGGHKYWIGGQKADKDLVDKATWKRAGVHCQSVIDSIYVDEDKIVLTTTKPYYEGSAVESRMLEVVQYANPITAGAAANDDVALGTVVGKVTQPNWRSLRWVDGNYVDGLNTFAIYDNRPISRMKDGKLQYVTRQNGNYSYLVEVDFDGGVINTISATSLESALNSASYKKQGVCDVDFSGDYLYVTTRKADSAASNKKGWFYVTKLDISNPESIRFVSEFQTYGEISRATNANYKYVPDLTINGSYGYLQTRGMADGSEVGDPRTIVIDLGGENGAMTEVMQYIPAKTEGGYENKGWGWSSAVAIGNYLFNIDGRKANGQYRKIRIWEFNDDKTDIVAADEVFSKIRTFNKNYGYGIADSNYYDGAIYNFYNDPNIRNSLNSEVNKGNIIRDGAKFSMVKLPSLELYRSDINAPYANNRGEVVISGTVYERPTYIDPNNEWSGSLDGLEKLYANVNGEEIDITSGFDRTTGKYRYALTGLEDGETYDVKVYPSLYRVITETGEDETTGEPYEYSEVIAEKHADCYDETVFLYVAPEGSIPFEITDVTLNGSTDKTATVSYILNSGDALNGRVIVGLYKDGILEGVSYSNADVAINVGAENTAVVDVPDTWTSLTGSNVRLFVWQHETIVPLVEPIEYENY